MEVQVEEGFEEKEFTKKIIDADALNFFDQLPEVLQLALEDFEQWARSGDYEQNIKKLVYMFNMTPGLLRHACRTTFEKHINRLGARIDSKKTRERFHGEMIKFTLAGTDIVVWARITLTKKYYDFSMVSIAEAKNPAKYRNQHGNLYMIRLDGLRFRPGSNYPGEYTLMAVTGHALDRFSQRIGIEERLTREESINVFVNHMLLRPVKMVLESIDSTVKERVKKATIFVDTGDGIIYLPGQMCLLGDVLREMKGNFMVCKTAINNDNFQAKSLHQIRDFKLTEATWNETPTCKNYFTTVFNTTVREELKPVTMPLRRVMNTKKA